MIIREDKNTKVLAEEVFQYNAPHNFRICKTDEEFETVDYVHFQEGPIKECGINGVSNEHLLAMVICRLEHFQNSKFACPENEQALGKLKEVLQIMDNRTAARETRGVEGINVI